MMNKRTPLFAFLIVLFSMISPAQAQAAVDLIVTQTNNVGGASSVGNTWIWDVRLTNNGTEDIEFTGGQTLLTDLLPSGLSYSNLTPISAGGASTAFPTCSKSGLTVTCRQNSGRYIIFSANHNDGKPGFVGFQINVTAAAEGAYTNASPASGCMGDPDNVITEANEDNNTCSNTVNVIGPPDLVATKTNDVDGSVFLGDSWNWDMAIENTGVSAATFAHQEEIFRDQLPTTNLSYSNSPLIASSGVTGTIFCNLNSGTLSCTANGVVGIAAGGGFTTRVVTTPSAAGIYTNPRSEGVCMVDPRDEVVEENEDNNTCSDTVTVIDPANLRVSKTNNVNDSIYLGDSWDWDFAIENTGDLAANFADSSKIFQDDLPTTDMSYGNVSITTSSNVTGTILCDLANGTILCTASGEVDIAGGGGFTARVTATPSAGGTFTNPRKDGTCMVDPAGVIDESNENNNTCSNTVDVIDPPNLVVSKTNSVDGSVFLGDSWDWDLTIENKGVTAATFADLSEIFQDQLPTTDISYDDASITASSGVTGSILCNLNTDTIACAASGEVEIAAGGSFTVGITATASATGVYTNPRSGGTCMVDPGTQIVEVSDSDNDCAPNSVTVNPTPSFQMSFAPDPIFVGDVATLTFTIDNSGSTDAVAATSFSLSLAPLVVATPPNAATSCTGGTLTAVAGSDTITYAGGSVASGAICTIQVDVTADEALVYASSTGDLTSSAGNSGPASGTLEVRSIPASVPTLAQWTLMLLILAIMTTAFRRREILFK